MLRNRASILTLYHGLTYNREIFKTFSNMEAQMDDLKASRKGTRDDKSEAIRHLLVSENKTCIP